MHIDTGRRRMYRLTEDRFEKAKPILERYRTQLHNRGKINARGLEKELRKCWDSGYQEVKDIVKRLSKTTRYRYLAAYYMEHSETGGVVTEFWPTLSELYGIDYYQSPMREKKREAFWKKLRAK
jgi:hypothetical protein